jgi:ribosomal protein S8E
MVCYHEHYAFLLNVEDKKKKKGKKKKEKRKKKKKILTFLYDI